MEMIMSRCTGDTTVWRWLASLCLGGYLVISLAHAEDLCAYPGRWIDPHSRALIPVTELYPQLVQQQVLLLGEQHDNAEHHRWQLHTLAALHAQQPNLLLGLEMFPRSVQPVLDRWVAGELSETEFLRAVNWEQVWGFDAGLYLPLFHFARLQQLPMVALNVDAELISAVAQRGWEAIPSAQREGLSDPAPAAVAYQEILAEVYRTKLSLYGDAAEDLTSVAPAEALAGLVDEPEFQYFVQAQLTWDRAMAQALVEAQQTYQGSLAVGIMGLGHVRYGHGVPHQLNDLGLKRVRSLLPLTTSEDCEGLGAEIAQAVFTVPAYHPPEVSRPQLGVMIEDADGGVKVTRVVADSVAAAAGLQTDDVIVMAAGEPLGGVSDLLRVIRRQAPGTWLPLELRRLEESLEVVARFPPATDSP